MVRFLPAVVVILIAFGSASAAQAKIVARKTIDENGATMEFVFASRPSRHNQGGGYCGAGRETTLHVYRVPSHELLLTLPIESCLHDIGLDHDTGDDPRAFLTAIDFDHRPILIHWFSKDDHYFFTGAIDLSSGIPVYSEDLTRTK